MAELISKQLQPDFYQDFHCVAAACRNNCCSSSWRILVDKANYKKLRKLREPKFLVENFGRYYIRSKQAEDTGAYAELAHNGSRCVWQDDRGLCDLQNLLGEQYLCETCKAYPRQKTLVTDDKSTVVIEQTMMTSCEEVVRLLLEHREPIQFLVTEKTAGSYAKEKVACGIHLTSSPALEHYDLVRSVCVAILQDRDYSFCQRMVLLCLYLEKLDAAEKEGRAGDFPAITEQFVAAQEQRLYHKVLTMEVDMASAAKLANYTAFVTFLTADDGDVLARINRGIDKHPDPATLVPGYRAYMEDKDYFLENIFVNQLFLQSIPFRKDSSIWDCARYMVALYTIYRFVLASYLAGDEDITPTQLIDLTAYYGKHIFNSTRAYGLCISLMDNNGMKTAAHMIGLIKGW